MANIDNGDPALERAQKLIDTSECYAKAFRQAARICLQQQGHTEAGVKLSQYFEPQGASGG